MTKHRPKRKPTSLPGGARGTAIVAIVGRPNVGKSTLFNRFARRRLAIVHDEPGVTRDRHYADTTAYGRSYTIVDTGGFDPEDPDPMRAGIARHVREAIAEADVIVFVTDATTALTTGDRAAVDLLRRAKKPVFFAANKADRPGMDPDAFELYRLGVETVYPVSALHGRGVGELEAAFVEALPEEGPETGASAEGVSRVAIVGKPNAGKSSLLNRLLGEERMLVDNKPGTTRDAIDTNVAPASEGGRAYVFVDTAGIRRKAKVYKAEDAVESVSVLQAIRSLERTEVAVLICDAAEGVAEQDAKILGMAEERGRGMIIALNKCDLLDKKRLDKAEEDARDKLSFAPYAPIVRISAKTGRGVPELLRTIDRVRDAFTSRVTTGELNRFFAEVIDTRSPPTSGGRAPRLYFITQAETAPPTFVVIASHPESVHFSYRRFISNQLRKRFGFEGVPIRVLYKEKRRGSRKRAEGAEKSED